MLFDFITYYFTLHCQITASNYFSTGKFDYKLWSQHSAASEEGDSQAQTIKGTGASLKTLFKGFLLLITGLLRATPTDLQWAHLSTIALLKINNDFFLFYGRTMTGVITRFGGKEVKMSTTIVQLKIHLFYVHCRALLWAIFIHSFIYLGAL